MHKIAKDSCEPYSTVQKLHSTKYREKKKKSEKGEPTFLKQEGECER